MKKRFIFFFALLLLVNIPVIKAQKAKADKPNIVFILIDDLGWMDLGCQGSRVYQTPNIDRLADESVRFTSAYAAHPRCVPSRYAIMTGNYPARGGVPQNRSKLKVSEKTFARFLKEAGYTSCYIGKWHLGDDETGPRGMGFDKSIAAGHAGSPRNYFAPFNATGGKKWKEKKSPIPDVDNAPEGTYLNDYLTDEAIKFMDENKEKPFFLMMAHYAVHEPLQAPDSLTEKYKTIIENTRFPEGPDYIMEGTGRCKMKQDNAVYAGMVDNMDMNIGRLLDFLKKNNLEKNTIIIFTSDHGGLSDDGYHQRRLATSNQPLRAGKGWLYEGGIRVPLLIRWPGVSTPSVDNKTIVTGIDFYPTIAALVTGKQVHSDGVSIVPAIMGNAMEHRDPVFWFSPKARPRSTGDANSIAIRDGNYKLIEWYETGKSELFDIKEDIGEQHDLSEQLPQIKRTLLKELNRWKKEMKIKTEQQ